MVHTLAQLASIGGAEVRGLGTTEILGVCPADSPIKGHLCFLRDAGQAKVSLLVAGIAAAIVPPSLVEEYKDLPLLVASDPVLVFAKILAHLHPATKPKPGIHPSAVIDPSAELGEELLIGPGCTIGPRAKIGARSVLIANVHIYEDASIGEDCYLHTEVCIRERCRIGKRCLIHNGAVIGADGFGFVADPEIFLRKVPQVGIAVIGDDVEIGANSCVDRATIGETVVGSHSKLDNLVQVGHNVKIGNFCLLCASSKVGGSCILGDGVVLGGGVGVADHSTLAPGVRLAGMSGVTKSLLVKGDYGGIPAVPARIWKRQAGIMSILGRSARPFAKLKGGAE